MIGADTKTNQVDRMKQKELLKHYKMRAHRKKLLERTQLQAKIVYNPRRSQASCEIWNDVINC